MRFRSTGLGKTELKGKMSDLRVVEGELIVFHIKTHEPVEWHLRAGLEPRDIPKILKGVLQPSVLFHMMRTLFHIKKRPQEIDDIMDKFL